MYIFLIPIILSLLLLAIWFFVCRNKIYFNDWPEGILIIGIVIVCVTWLYVALMFINDTLEYYRFEEKYLLQTRFYESTQFDNKNNPVFIIGTTELNKELFEYQAIYLTYGPNWTFVPSRVMSLKPITFSEST